MTTTHTFQGLNTDSRPSSRVLNPPGGSSSNIFGSEDQLKQKSSVNTSAESVIRVKNDAIGQGLPAPTAGPQQQQSQSKASRIGDKSFPSDFDIYQSPRSDKVSSNIRVNTPVSGFIQSRRKDSAARLIFRSNYNTTDTFKNLFGEGTMPYRKMFRRIQQISDDSFPRVFGQDSLLDCKKLGAPLTLRVNNIKYDSSDHKLGKNGDSTVHLSQASVTGTVSKFDKVTDERNSTYCMFYKKGSLLKEVPLSQRCSPKSAYNPITGEPYGQSKSNREPHNPVILSDNGCSKAPVGTVSGTGINQTCPASTASDNRDKPQPTPAVSTAQQKQQQHSSGLFGGISEDVKEHRSTRVSQPPGGHSTKLW